MAEHGGAMAERWRSDGGAMAEHLVRYT